MIENDIRQRLFHGHLELLPQMNEIYELELAFVESQLLDNQELVDRGAYFAAVSDVPTNHFRLCAGGGLHLPDGTARKRRQFFVRNQFRTGYATHGLFPYRGKFHPQMVKGILNVMGLRPGDTVLDPMMGSGTTLVEAALMGIDSVGFDVSPFCQFMAAAKLDGFEVSLDPLDKAVRESESLFRFFGGIETGKVPLSGAAERYCPVQQPSAFSAEWFEPKVWSLLLLAFLDSVGFAERSSRQAPNIQFRGILERYAAVTRKLQQGRAALELPVGHAKAEQCDARSLPLPSSSIDGVLFSPPYSFAVDYVENDAPHLRVLGANLGDLRESIVGLRGRTLRQKFDTYVEDMELVLKECARVLRSQRCCAIVIGTNSNQLGKLFGKDPDQVDGLDKVMIRLAEVVGMNFVRRFERRIVGLANTMRDEDILLFRKQ
ncbi:MAG: DNA methyltransferase [Verrucomicrobia bacterium]|nr:DNA methyltransferase [Verrucomicrobiota bacterium]